MPERKTTALLCLIAGGLLLFALFAKPGESYLEFIKYAVLIASGYVALALYARSERLAPLALCLLALGTFEAFGKLHRQQWQPWNWSMIASFSISACALAWPTKSLPSANLTKDKDASGMGEPGSSKLPSQDTSICSEQGKVLTRVTREAGGRPVIHLSPEDGATGILAGMAVTFADSMTGEDKVALSHWAGLDYKVWEDNHRQAFTAAFLHHAQDVALGKCQAPEVLTNLGRELKERLPPLVKPLTREIRSLVNRMVGG